ncbi:MAG: hypothetical protein HRU15_03620 [Planctomycetes bacterium]|nr:hypothetical protein [Planctomycetota bacterium]
MAIEIDAAFPGGNIIVDAIDERADGYYVQASPDLSDTSMNWFYWYARLRGLKAGQKLQMDFGESLALGTRGPAYSLNGGADWQWLGAASLSDNSFEFIASDEVEDLRCAFAIPYLVSDWLRFLSGFSHADILQREILCTTRRERENFYYRISAKKERRHRILLTSRHHCCEMVPGFVWEGLCSWLAEDEGASYLREHVEIILIPFVDLDGVEDGDQGKGRIPHDHARDYNDQCLYPSCAAIKNMITELAAEKLDIILDAHCPWIAGGHNETVYLVGSAEPRIAQEQQVFSQLLEQHSSGEIQVQADDYLPYGVDWNTDANYGKGNTAGRFAAQYENIQLIATMEIPYATANGAEINANTARAFGADLGRSISAYLKK